MDAFFASVEQRDNPELQGKAIAVGGGENRGVVTTASYEARKYGVRSAMPGFMAKKLCPHLVFVKPRFEVYGKVSRQIRGIFKEYTDLIEPLSFDEAFLDVTDNKKRMVVATELAKNIMKQVSDETNLTCSAGVSYCKFLAKVASGMRKPNGITIIKPHQAEAFLEKLPIEKFFGVGKVTANRMKALGIHNGADLKAWSKLRLANEFGKIGQFYYDIVRGVDERPVEPNRVRKSLAVERTLEKDLETLEDISPILEKIVDMFHHRLQRANNFGRTITLKIKTHDFKTQTRSHSEDYFIKEIDQIRQIAFDLLEENLEKFGKIRLIGLTASNLQSEKTDDSSGQLNLFE